MLCEMHVLQETICCGHVFFFLTFLVNIEAYIILVINLIATHTELCIKKIHGMVCTAS